ncbi:NAD(P)/FAD-dependent oxidoreductase [Aphanothece sacrum]|uniref:FAD dependent oxidoreductase domain-containing protein n=1 Tax=Aphanothece sacrum FPU1 TaxID=1920663 RepID=A0A401IFW9_APHSA|nr:FAD-binding oxidoreductase [Aphanothece sacrum]GBF80080.1 hypothetical protein AsFPU1_1481 [Aphanothece sacrum FPU1]GBF84624.1 hypothetical protein AsFPU3_1676 [Aphanothece sacrum FPU3]
MTNYDWIVIGSGITGSALSYELIKKGLSVLLLEKDPKPDNATSYSYGGLAYASGTDKLSRQLCQEGIELHRHLSQELEADTEFREVDLCLTIASKNDPKTIAKNYDKFVIKPEILTVKEACELEPLLNPDAISGVLKLPNGHINPSKTNQAYQQAFLRLGGDIKFECVNTFIQQENEIQGVVTSQNQYYAKNTVICAGGLSCLLLKELGINLNLYFTHAQLIMTPPVDFKLSTMVMPGDLQRLNLEEKATNTDMITSWNNQSSELIADVIDPGIIQFLNGSLCLGQISQIITNPHTKSNSIESENRIRQEVCKIIPALENISGTWHNCLVAFTPNADFLVGQINELMGLYVFSGFTHTFVIAPPLARHFVSWVTGETNISALGINEHILHIK